jgi:hypothetical protein
MTTSATTRSVVLVVAVLLAACSSNGTSPPPPTGPGGSTGGTGAPGGSGTPGGSGGGGTAPGGSGGTAPGGSGGTTPGGSAGGTGGAPIVAPDAAPAADGSGPSAPVAPGAFPGCPNCKPIFDGKTLDGWLQDPAGSFTVKDGAIASTGKGAHAWTKDDYGDFRIIFSVRQVMGGHKPCTTLFCTRPASGKATRGLSGIQFQPPLGGSWDYRPGKNVGPNGTAWTYPNPRPMFDVKKWHRCEILARASKGEFRGACCEIEGKDSCKAVEVLHFVDPTAGKKGPFALMMHNGGLFDEYKDLWVETDPAGDELITTR